LSLSAYAKQELDDVVRYLELEFEGLGKRFKAEVKRQQSGSLSILKHGQLNVGT
jgi:hypothetical protein